MGTVELLTRKAKSTSLNVRRRDQLRVQCPLLNNSEAITHLPEQYDRVEAEEARLSDSITGFVDPNAEEEMAPTATHVSVLSLPEDPMMTRRR